MLAIIFIGGGYWLYLMFNPINSAAPAIQEDVELARVFKAKEIAIKNIEDFLKTPKSPDSIFESLYNSKQFTSLKKVEIDISLDHVGNPEPFYSLNEEE